MGTDLEDVLLLGRLIDGWIDRARRANALRQRMEEEGRTSLTAEELGELQVGDDQARGDLVGALDRARAEGR